MKLHIHLSPDWILDSEMREYSPQETVDFCIIGTGAGGGVLAQRLARYGFSVVTLEAGAWHDSEKDMVSDEAGSSRLYWNDLRITGGTEPLELGANNSGKGVGGGTVHYAAFCPRFHRSDFRVRSQGSANPALTISALAARTADWIRQAVPRGELRARPSAVKPVGL